MDRAGASTTKVLVVVFALTAACGTRVSGSSNRALGSGPASPISALPATPADAGSVPVSPGSGAGPVDTLAASGAPLPGNAPAASNRPVSSPSAAGAKSSVGATQDPPVGSAPATKSPGPRGGSPANIPPPTVPQVGGAKSPILVASVGIIGGPIGAVFGPVAQGGQLWAKYLNAKGGLGGREVRLIIYDDGGDPARHRAQVQEAIETKKVVAFVSNPDGLAGAGSVDYITSKRVPVIGGDTAGGWYYESPVYFPQTTGFPYVLRDGLAAAAQEFVPKGKTKLGTLACVEADQCAQADKTWAAEAKGLGFNPVYQARASVAQPDFTAECLRAAGAGVQVFVLGLDASAVYRVAGACARQDFHPVFASLSTLVEDKMKENANLEGLVASSSVFPYFRTGTPATDEFQSVYTRFGSSVKLGVSLATGWVAGKLLERAAVNLPEPPTSEAILKGLWSIKNDDLGGLTSPLTFTEGQTAPRTECWFTMAIKDKAWTSPDGYRTRCWGKP